MFKKLSIQWKVALSTSIYILLVLIGAILFTFFSFEQKLLSEKKNSTIKTIESVIESYKEAFIVLNLEKINELVSTLLSIPSVTQVQIFDPSGKIIGDKDLKSLGLVKKEKIKLFKNIPVKKQSKNLIDFYYPIKIDEDILGYAYVQYDLNLLKRDIDKDLLKILLQTVAIAFFVIVFSAAGTFLISGYMIKPLKVLKEKILSLTSSNMNELIELKPFGKKKEICPKDETQYCWLTAENGKEILQELGNQALDRCSTCDIFKKYSGDEIQQLTLSFYMMVSSLQDYLNKLEKAHKERETLNCMATMGEMSAKIAHEVKNALYAIGNAANYLRHNIDNELVREFSGIIKNEVNRLNELTVSFLNFSKLIEPKFEKGNLNKEVKHSVELLKEDFEDEGIKVVYDFDENIPEFEFDKNLIRQVIFNLVLNSLDALKEKNVKEKYIKISTRYIKKKNDKIVLLFVEDNGIGIKEEHKEKIFKPFFTTKQKGTGLGLPMVYKIIYSHNGIINMQSRYGEGTRFDIEFKIN
ncbi:MAG: two-component sensor histidine kinase [Aquificae bacterium]|nr:two-component sensor histidine kinase [Aquificota bacterium]